MKQIVQGVGEPLGEVAVAVLAIALAIKNQPAFDRKAFDDDIRLRISGKGDSMSKRMLEILLDDPPSNDANAEKA